jgi:hypothetical protein
MNKIRCSRVLDVEELRELLELTPHEARALIGNNRPDIDDFPLELSTYRPRVGGHGPLSAHTEAL